MSGGEGSVLIGIPARARQGDRLRGNCGDSAAPIETRPLRPDFVGEAWLEAHYS
jgi:hypothetical protein